VRQSLPLRHSTQARDPRRGARGLASRPYPGEKDVVGSDGEQHQIEIAVGLIAAGRPQELRQLGDLGRTVPEQAAPVPGLGHSRARWLLRNPALMVAPEQPSGMNVTARCGFSMASASAVRI
jgi:hypothetical protein